MAVSSTGTTIKSYLTWLEEELDKKQYGEVSVSFTILRGQIVDVKKVSVDSEHFQLDKSK